MEPAAKLVRQSLVGRVAQQRMAKPQVTVGFLGEEGLQPFPRLRPGQHAVAIIGDPGQHSRVERLPEDGGAPDEGDGDPVAIPLPPEGDPAARAAWAARLARMRFAARQRKDWARADAARSLLQEHGFEVRDSREGVEVVPRRKAPPG